MRTSAIGTAFVIVACALPTATWSGAGVGVGYSAEGDALIFGGLQLNAMSRDPADYQSVYLQRSGNATRVLLRRFDGVANDVSVAPRGSLIALIEGLSEHDVSPDRANYVSRTYDFQGRPVEIWSRIQRRLTIMNFEGQVLQRVEDVYRYSWSPDGSRIAYITGRYSEKKSFDSTGTWIYDVGTQKATRIYPGGQDVEWAAWDGSIYVDTSLEANSSPVVVKRFNPASGQLSATQHRGIYFSPDGKFYFRSGGEGEIGGEVFDAVTDRQVVLAPLIELGKPVAPVASGWLADSTLVMRTPGGSEAGYIQDLKDGTRSRVDGNVFPKGSTGVLFVLRNGAFTEQAMPSLRD